MDLSAPSPISTPTSVPAISNSPRRPWQRRRLWAAAAAGLVLVAGIGLVQRQRGTSQANLEAYTVLAASGDLPGVVSASGELEAEKRVNVSPKRQGVIEELYVEEGDPVDRGQALARMDRGDLDERLAELRAQLRSAQAQL
ncbi:MAG: biotin/lipoyl-binding protein, partial [Cyanobium sp. MAG_255]|nr:biotin/lipoyl-binding protein [Cyanobium sp. MAG_255]